jgi:hypothetical protein
MASRSLGQLAVSVNGIYASGQMTRSDRLRKPLEMLAQGGGGGWLFASIMAMSLRSRLRWFVASSSVQAQRLPGTPGWAQARRRLMTTFMVDVAVQTSAARKPLPDSVPGFDQSPCWQQFWGRFWGRFLACLVT